MHITIAVSGFQQEVWSKSFFPDDLPEDWRFDYYANEFRAIFLDKSDRHRLGSLVFEQILSEANAGFTFALEVDGDQNADFGLVYDTKSTVLMLEFGPTKVVVSMTDIFIEQAVIVHQQNNCESACVLRVSSNRVPNNEEIKRLLVFINAHYGNFDRVYVFFAHGFMAVKVLNAARVINELL